MPMRCRWPPENWCGKRLIMSGDEPDQVQQLGHPIAAGRAVVPVR